MKNLRGLLLAGLALALCLGVTGTGAAGDPTDLYWQIDDDVQQLYFRTLIAPPDGTDMVYYWKGYVYLDLTGDKHAPPYPGAPGNWYPHGGGNGGTPVFGFEGYNIRRAVPNPANPSQFILATREIVFYTDPVTGEVLNEWHNPITGKTVPVIPVLNEYLWTKYNVEGGVLKGVIDINFPVGPGMCYHMESAGPVGAPEEWADQYVWHADIFPRYRLNDCGRYGIVDPMGLVNGKYTSAEIFEFYVDQKDVHRVDSHDAKWVPNVKLSWIRTGPWLPWMGMDSNQFDGHVTYHVRSELLRTWSDMPAEFRAKMAAYGFPLGGLDLEGWQHAPEVYEPERVNDTSWSIFYDRVLAPAGLTWAEWAASLP